MIKKLFPTSTRATDLTGLIVSLLIYIVLPAIVHLVANLLGGIPLIGWILGIIAGVIDLYCLIGIVVSLLIFFKVIK
ncbi:MAG: hypothetical protein IJC18_03335 [Clostridia bacterium]|nr:hypothetical protein [Clostridia bacterium]MBQ9993319.1 hypothetical protein [Clostridia bacterium]